MEYVRKNSFRKNMNTNNGNLLSLPKDVIYEIQNFLDTYSKIKIKSTNKFFYNFYYITIDDLWNLSNKSLQNINNKILDKLNPFHLKKINLRNCSELINLQNFINLEELNISKRNSTEIPYGCIKLTKLFVNGGDLLNLNNFTNLKSLKINHTNQTPIFSNLVNLEDLEIFNSKISIVPENLIKLTRLTITCRGEIVDTSTLTCFTNLKYLYLSDSYTISFTTNLTNLEAIDAERCNLKIPSNSSKLTKLIIRKYDSKNINNLTNLKILKIAYDENENNIYNLTKLENLCLGKTSVNFIPSTFINLTSLTIFGNDCKIENIENLISLESLSIQYCNIKNLENFLI